jgi:hypothetical protein
MSDLNRTFRERLFDRVVLRTLGVLFLIAFICPVLNSQFFSAYVDEIPIYPDRPSCSELPAPLGGNQRSLLDYLSNPNDPVELELALSKQTFTVGEPIEVILTVKNNDKASIVLHLPTPNVPAFLGYVLADIDLTPAQGVVFEITNVANGNTFAQPGGDYQPPPSYNAAQMHLLGPRTNCRETYDLDWNNLAAIGMAVGEYRIRAMYRNTQPGSNPSFPDRAEATPIPEYTTTQGVWTTSPTGVTSNEVRFAVVNQPTPQPPQPGQ